MNASTMEDPPNQAYDVKRSFQLADYFFFFSMNGLWATTDGAVSYHMTFAMSAVVEAMSNATNSFAACSYCLVPERCMT